MKYFKNIKSFDDLKKQFRTLLKKNHPDNGGDMETMKEINVEYDALFPIWKEKAEKETGEEIKETAAGTRSDFYTANGWEGSNHRWDRSLKEVAQIVRAYVKEKYPTYKFSVRTEYASMCQELHVKLKESPVDIYKTIDELNDEDKTDLLRKFRANWLWDLDCWSDEDFNKKTLQIWEEKGDFFKCLNEVTKAVIADVDSFVKSYNYSDCDGMIDYFDVDFYYFGCSYSDVKIVPKTPRIKNKNNDIAKTRKTAKKEKTEPEKIETTSDVTYSINKGEDTRDGSTLWIVRINESLSKNQYIAENNKMKDLGGYYSKFKHGFIFREDPTEKLNKIA